MELRHTTSLQQDGITVIAVAKDTLAAINEGTCAAGPTPLVAKLLEEFSQAIGAAPGPIVVDIRDTQFIDHASMSVMFRLAKLVTDDKKRGFICTSNPVKETLDLCRLNTICPTTTKLEEALTALSGGIKLRPDARV